MHPEVSCCFLDNICLEGLLVYVLLFTVVVSWTIYMREDTSTVLGANSKGITRPPECQWNHVVDSMVARGMLQNVLDRQQFQQLGNRRCCGQADAEVGFQGHGRHNRRRWSL